MKNSSKNFIKKTAMLAVFLGLFLAGCGSAGYRHITVVEHVPYEVEVPIHTPSPMPSPIPIATPLPTPSPTPEPTPTPEPSFADIWLEKLTVEEKIGQLIMPRLVWQTTAPCPEVTAWVAHYGFGGIILFGDNVYSIAQVQAMSAALQAASPYLPLFIAIDEEGGRVSRVGRLFDWQIPAAYSILATIKCDCFGADNCEHRCVNFHAQANREAARLAHETGQRLTTLGINMNFAPVADVWTNPANTVIGNRAFSRDPYAAAEMVATTIYGLQRENIFAVAKHFPGHGDTYEDSHFNLAFYPHDRARFDTVEAIPFIRAIEAGVDGIMVGHISTPQLRGSAPILCWKQDAFENGWLPATFSDFWLQDVLRGEMGFEGLIVTDALDMRALTDHFTPEQIAVGAFLAGADILLMPTHPDRAFYALLDAFREGLITLERLEASVRRVLYAKADILP